MKPRYYCENCGAEVRPGAVSCPACGSRFTAVRCPQCGFEGRESDFRAGCPSCGYMVEALHGEASAPPVAPEPRKRTRLPPWFYRAAAIALVAAVVILLVVLLVHG